MIDFSFVQITDHHLLDAEAAIRAGFGLVYLLQAQSVHVDSIRQECLAYEGTALPRDDYPTLMRVLGTLS